MRFQVNKMLGALPLKSMPASCRHGSSDEYLATTSLAQVRISYTHATADVARDLA